MKRNMSAAKNSPVLSLDELINRADGMRVLPSVARKVMEMVELDEVSSHQRTRGGCDFCE
jgi:hypothetical protein